MPLLGTPVDAGPVLAGKVREKIWTVEERVRLTAYVAGALVGVVGLIVAFMTALELLPWGTEFTTDFVLIAALGFTGPYGWFYVRDLKMQDAIDDKFPDFLRDLAESARAGMTLSRALVAASAGNYGALDPEIRRMAAQVGWGVSFNEAFERFGQRLHSALIRRIVTLVNEAQRSGGNLVDILTVASEDAREIRQGINARTLALLSYGYVIYISFAVFLVVVIVLQSQFIPAFANAVDAATGSHLGSRVGGVQFAKFSQTEFTTLFFHAALFMSIGGGLVAGALTKGKPMAKYPAIVAMCLISWLIFRVVVEFI